jgi:hypothetical protein
MLALLFLYRIPSHPDACTPVGPYSAIRTGKTSFLKKKEREDFDNDNGKIGGGRCRLLTCRSW